MIDLSDIGSAERYKWLAAFLVMVLPVGLPNTPAIAGEFVGVVVDETTGSPIAARIYLQGADGEWHFCKADDPEGTAWPYAEQWVPMPRSVEKHTTVSAHRFRAKLPPGQYELTVERGKEYHPFKQKVEVGSGTTEVQVRLRRWIDMAERGWYSGETHVHRRIRELPNVMLAEDLNVAFPVTFWTTQAHTAPNREPSTLRSQGPSPFGPREDYGYEPIEVDRTHIIFPRNTEYEVFSVEGRSHLLGAIFVLNHRTRFERGVPPVGPVARQAHAEGALLDLDKHSWPWSMMLVPIAKVDLFELANNSVWRTEFGFRQSPVAPADYMKVEQDEGGLTEWGWLDFGFQSYYALLNCGFRLQPTAGTASGVHPVPLGFNRVYVEVETFSGEAWIEGLRAGRSFVTNGPMLLARLHGQSSGHVFRYEQGENREHSLQVEVTSRRPIERVEVIQNGDIIAVVTPEEADHFEMNDAPAAVLRHRWSLAIDQPSWVVVRAFERQEDGRLRFAHTAPWHLEFAGRQLLPKRSEIDYLVKWMEREVNRNREVLPEDGFAEFTQALEIYRAIQARVIARDGSHQDPSQDPSTKRTPIPDSKEGQVLSGESK
jgi:hypothetical protein